MYRLVTHGGNLKKAPTHQEEIIALLLCEGLPPAVLLPPAGPPTAPLHGGDTRSAAARPASGNTTN